ncbi:MAG: hypothetical protein ACFFCS_09475 [Candidatus Hodarchaeota archaeon]
MNENTPSNDQENLNDNFESKFMNYFNQQLEEKVDELNPDPTEVIAKGQKPREEFMKDQMPKLKRKKFRLELLYI